MVDDMTPDAETLALTREMIQADAESQLLRNGLRVHSSGSMPALYFQISVLCDGPRSVRHRRLVGGRAGGLPRGDGHLVDPRQDLVHRPDHAGAAVGRERERAQRRPRPGRRVRRRRPGSAACPPARGEAVGGAVAGAPTASPAAATDIWSAAPLRRGRAARSVLEQLAISATPRGRRGRRGFPTSARASSGRAAHLRRLRRVQRDRRVDQRGAARPPAPCASSTAPSRAPRACPTRRPATPGGRPR